MRLVEKIIQIGIFAICLAIYNLWFMDMFLSMFGEKVGFGEVALGYFVVGLFSWVISWIMLKALKRSAQEEEGP